MAAGVIITCWMKYTFLITSFVPKHCFWYFLQGFINDTSQAEKLGLFPSSLFKGNEGLCLVLVTETHCKLP